MELIEEWKKDHFPMFTFRGLGSGQRHRGRQFSSSSFALMDLSHYILLRSSEQGHGRLQIAVKVASPHILDSETAFYGVAKTHSYYKSCSSMLRP